MSLVGGYAIQTKLHANIVFMIQGIIVTNYININPRQAM